jgi:predicted metal-dependent phosphoesterase TrpH
MWNVELHSHTYWSKDSIISAETVIKLCRARGIDKIAITDHNTADGALAMQRIAPDLVVVGEEIMTTQGELLGYFLKESIPAGLTPQETIRCLRDQGAAISVSHPFDRLRKGAWHEADLRAIIDQVDAIEIFNARCLYPEDNARAIAFAQEHDLLGTVGSDAHCRAEYGRAVEMMPPFEDAEGFIESLRAAQSLRRYSGWMVHLNSKTAKWSKKLKLRSPLWEGG